MSTTLVPGNSSPSNSHNQSPPHSLIPLPMLETQLTTQHLPVHVVTHHLSVLCLCVCVLVWWWLWCRTLRYVELVNADLQSRVAEYEAKTLQWQGKWNVRHIDTQTQPIHFARA